MNRRMFGIKDLFTSLNCVAGVIALCLCVEGYPFEAGLAIILGYLGGDALDGWVARKLGTANKFGAEFDVIVDHLSHVIAPAVIVYVIYVDAALLSARLANQILGGALAAAIILSASIRHARNVVNVIEYKGIWSGLPRTVLGFLAIGFVLSMTVQKVPEVLWAGLVLIPVLSIAQLTRLPFANHRLPRKHYAYVRVLIFITFGTLIAAIAFYPRVLFDLLFIALAAYTLGSATVLTTDERAQYREAVRSAVQGSA